MIRRIRFCVCLALITVVLGAGGQVTRADTPITVAEQKVESKFRQSLVFRIRAKSAAGNIIRARLVWESRSGHGGFPRRADEFTPAPEVNLSYTWETADVTTPPWQVIVYHWEVTDDAGNTLTTDRAQVEMTDDTRDWQNLSDGKVAVYWYDHDEAFGKRLLKVTQQGFDHVSRATGYTPRGELRVVMYNNQVDFCSFYAPRQCKDWVAGVTFGSLTVQWLDRDEGYALYQTVPHELAHAFLQDWLGPRMFAVPRWFDEGQAVNNQLEGVDSYLRQARTLARNGALERLAYMEAFASIGQDDLEKTGAWYAQAASLVAYLYDRYGLDSLGKILTQINAGKKFEAAFTAVTGVSLDEFELGWREWLGAKSPPPTFAPTPTFNPFPPSPTYEPG